MYITLEHVDQNVHSVEQAVGPDLEKREAKGDKHEVIVTTELVRPREGASARPQRSVSS